VCRCVRTRACAGVFSHVVRATLLSASSLSTADVPLATSAVPNLLPRCRKITEKNRLEEYQRELDEIYAGQLTSFDKALQRDFNQPLRLVLLGDDETAVEPSSPQVPRHSSATSFTTPGKESRALERSSTRDTPSSRRLHTQRKRLFGSQHYPNGAAADEEEEEDEEAKVLLKNYGVKKWFSWQYHHKPKRVAITAPHHHGSRKRVARPRSQST
jgi:hypothetical protein